MRLACCLGHCPFISSRRCSAPIQVTLIKGGSEMFTFHLSHRKVALVVCVFALTYSFGSVAEDIVSFATGGYARGLRTNEMMVKIDTNGDGMISKDECIAFQQKIFDMMDTSTVHKGLVGKEEIMFATGGANRR